MYLAAGGVGHLTLVDGDHVAASNLHRQILYGPDDVGRTKVDVALDALARTAPSVAVEAVSARLTEGSAGELLSEHDLVIDATDTFATRLTIADAAAASGVPVVWGAVQGYDGQVSVFRDGATLRDLLPEEPGLELDSCEGGAVLGTVCGVVGATMATEAIKVLAGVGDPLAGRVGVFEGRSGSWSAVPLRSSHG